MLCRFCLWGVVRRRLAACGPPGLGQIQRSFVRLSGSFTRRLSPAWLVLPLRGPSRSLRVFREAPEPEQNRLFCRVEFGSRLLVPGGQGSRTEALSGGQAGEVEQVRLEGGTHHQAGDRRGRPGQGFDWLRAAGQRGVEDESAGVQLATAGGLQEEGLRGGEGVLLQRFHAGGPEEQRGQQVKQPRPPDGLLRLPGPSTGGELILLGGRSPPLSVGRAEV